MASSLPLLLLLLCILGVAHSGLVVTNLRASGLRPDTTSNADGYVKVYCASAYLGQTDVVHNIPNPSWTKTFSYIRALVNDQLKLDVFDKDLLWSQRLGTCQVTIKTGSYSYQCSLSTGGVLYFSYSLS